MPEYHEPIEVIAGETWDIPGSLRDANGSPIDLTGATLEWALVDSGGNPVAITAEVTVIMPGLVRFASASTMQHTAMGTRLTHMDMATRLTRMATITPRTRMAMVTRPTATGDFMALAIGAIGLLDELRSMWH